MTTDSSLKRGLAVLRLFAEHPSQDPRGHTAAEVAVLLGRERSQVSRILRSLETARFLRRDPASLRYTVAWELYARAQQITEARLRRDGRTALEGVAADTGECAYLGVLRGASSVTILESMPPALSSFVSWVGRAYPAYCSDAGQALLFDADDTEVAAVLARTAFVRHGPNTPADLTDFLARLDAARKRGYSIVDQEAEPGLYSLAAPVRDFRGEIVAAVQVVGPRHRLEPTTAACADSVLRWSTWLTAALCSTEAEAEAEAERGRETEAETERGRDTETDQD
ncbi:IclR family transcriptional regulator [Streptomyces sp. NPDC090075]|uniref:IclR family transcriptional regulator n=1 Tax=Streptomyces sp. NPDC090075 TaxID=3365937 RepID=UPI003829F8D1